MENGKISAIQQYHLLSFIMKTDIYNKMLLQSAL